MKIKLHLLSQNQILNDCNLKYSRIARVSIDDFQMTIKNVSIRIGTK